MSKLELGQAQKKAITICDYIMVANITGDRGYLALALRDAKELVNELSEQLK